MTRVLRSTICLVLLASSGVLSQQIYNFYEPGDWVTYTNSRYVTAIARGFQTVFFGTTEGILRYDIIREKWLDPITVSDGMPENHVRRLAVDRLTDDIWVETTNYTASYNQAFEQWYTGERFPEDKVQAPGTSLSEFPQMFVNRGFNYFPGGLLIGRDLLEYRITQLLDDGDLVWVGVWGLGPGSADLRRASLDLMPCGPYESDIAAISLDKEDIWMAGGGDGLPGVISHYDRRNAEWEYIDPRRTPNIVSDQFYVVKEDEKNVWFGTELGLVQYDKRRNSFWSLTQSDGIYGERVTAILPAGNNVLVGTEMGVSVYDLKRDSIYVASSDNIRGRVLNDLELSGRTIFAATDYGVFTLEWGGSAWYPFLPSETVLQGVVTDIQVVDSVLYAAGEDGVVVYDLRGGDLTIYDRNTVFGNASLQVLLVSQGVVWAGSHNGLFRLNNRLDDWYRYHTADGLPSDWVTSLAIDGADIWIGTDSGLTRFRWDNRDRRDWK